MLPLQWSEALLLNPGRRTGAQRASSAFPYFESVSHVGRNISLFLKRKCPNARFPSGKQQQLSRRRKTLVFFSTLCFLPVILFCLRQKRRPWRSNRPHTEAASPAAPRLLSPQPYSTIAPLLAPLPKTQRDEKLPFDLSESSFAF